MRYLGSPLDSDDDEALTQYCQSLPSGKRQSQCDESDIVEYAPELGHYVKADFSAEECLNMSNPAGTRRSGGPTRIPSCDRNPYVKWGGKQTGYVPKENAKGYFRQKGYDVTNDGNGVRAVVANMARSSKLLIITSVLGTLAGYGYYKTQ